VRYRPSDEGLSYFPRVQKENEPEAKPTTKSTHNQRSQTRIPLASTIAIFILKLAFVPISQHSLQIPN
jgi:hypothetical protein